MPRGWDSSGWDGSAGRWGARGGWEPAGWRPPRAVTLWVPVVLSAIVQIPATLVLAATFAAPAAWTTIGLAVLGPAVLIGARRFPGPVVALVCAAASADLLVDRGIGPPYLAFAFGVVSAIVRGARVWAFVSVAVAWAGTIGLAIALGGPWNPFRVAGITFGILVLLGVGEFLRSRRDRFLLRQQEWTRRRQDAVQAERVRIARELHDVLAHSLSSINVQAGVGLHLMERDPGKAAEALATIKETSRTALDEVRSVLGVLRSDDRDAPLVPEPDLDRVTRLVDEFRDQGIEVRVSELPRDVPEAIQLALYRIVQEALTNVRRHSTATRVDVDLERTGDRVTVRIRDDGAPRPDAEPGGGRGLLGMRERAELLGGTFSAGPRPGGGWEVRAEIPAPVPAPSGADS